MVSQPETGSDSPIGSDRDWGRDNICMASVLFFVLDLLGFSDAPTYSLYT